MVCQDICRPTLPCSGRGQSYFSIGMIYTWSISEFASQPCLTYAKILTTNLQTKLVRTHQKIYMKLAQHCTKAVETESASKTSSFHLKSPPVQRRPRSERLAAIA